MKNKKYMVTVEYITCVKQAFENSVKYFPTETQAKEYVKMISQYPAKVICTIDVIEE